MTIRQTYKNRDIWFREDSDEWICDDLALTNKSLKSLKAAIDRADKENRKMNVQALYLDENYWDSKCKLFECTITLLRTERREKANIKIKGKIEQVELSSLYPMSERENLEALVEAKKQRALADKQVQACQNKLTPFTAESLREAVVQQADEAA